MKNSNAYILAVLWTLNWLYCCIFTGNLNNCEYYEGVLDHFGEQQTFTSDLSIPASKKNTEFRRVFWINSSSDYDCIRSNSKPGDSFCIYYGHSRKYLNVYRMDINGKVLIKYNWLKLHWIELLLAIWGLFACVGLPIWASGLPREKRCKQYAQFIVYDLSCAWVPKFVWREPVIEFILFDISGSLYLQLYVDRKECDVYKFGKNELSSKDSTYEIAKSIVNIGEHKDRLCMSNIFAQMDAIIREHKDVVF